MTNEVSGLPFPYNLIAGIVLAIAILLIIFVCLERRKEILKEQKQKKKDINTMEGTS